MKTEPQDTRDAIEEVAATWIAKRDGATWTAQDAAALDAWLSRSPGHRVAYYRLDSVWAAAGRVGQHEISSWHRMLAVAATLLLLVAGVVVWMQIEVGGSSKGASAPAVAQAPVMAPGDDAATTADAPVAAPTPGADAATFQQRYATAVGRSQAIRLPDGSRVTLDTDSRIRVSMGARARTVHLDRGQAYFEVAHDSARPFVVKADRVDVVAVGTAFSVRKTASQVRVVVAEGTVRLEGKGLLPAGGIARVEEASVDIQQVAPLEVQRNLSWRGGVLTFRHTKLADAVEEINRYGARPVVILDSTIASRELGGVFRTDDVEAFVHLLERTFPIDAARNPDRIELTARKTP